MRKIGQSLEAFCNGIGIGRPSRAFPPTPPGIRVRTMAVRKIALDLSLAEIRQSKLL